VHVVTIACAEYNLANQNKNCIFLLDSKENKLIHLPKMGGNVSTEYKGKKYEGGSIEEVVRTFVKENKNDNTLNTTKMIVDSALNKAEISKKSGGKPSDQLYNALKEADANLHFGTTYSGGMLMFGNSTPVVSLRDMMGDVNHHDQAEFGRRKLRKPKRSKRNSFGKKKRRGSKKSSKSRRA
jgi:hypothetical protein